MSTKETGGPAFPCDNIVERNEKGQLIGVEKSSAGITVRDYFAAKAMQGELAAMTSSDDGNSGCSVDIADAVLLRLTKHWYRIADAMLEARKS